VLASVEVAESRAARRRGLLGRSGIDGVLVIEPCRQVHSFGMRFPIDAIFCDRGWRVVRICRLPVNRVSRPVLRARRVIEAPWGAAARWALAPGEVLEVAEDPDA
jgi:uncharacterized membrane protein (UPF0127 family)